MAEWKIAHLVKHFVRKVSVGRWASRPGNTERARRGPPECGGVSGYDGTARRSGRDAFAAPSPNGAPNGACPRSSSPPRWASTRPTSATSRRAGTAPPRTSPAAPRPCCAPAALIWQRFREYDEARSAAGPARRAPPARARAVAAPAAGRPDRRDENCRPDLRRRALPLRGAAGRCTTPAPSRSPGTWSGSPSTATPASPSAPTGTTATHPLTWAELDLDARCGGRADDWRPKHDRDAFKEVWLLFENEDGPVPALPRPAGHHRVRVHRRRGQVGPLVPARRPAADPTLSSAWTSRPTLRPGGVGNGDLADRRGRPAAYPACTETRDEGPGHLRLVHRRPAAQRPLPAGMAVPRRGRRGPHRGLRRQRPDPRPSDRMRAAGVVQRGAPMLDRAARRFDLPDQARSPRTSWPGCSRAANGWSTCTSSARAWASPRRRSASAGPPRSSAPPGRPRGEPIVLLNPPSSASPSRLRRAVRGLSVLLRRPRPGAPARC